MAILENDYLTVTTVSLGGELQSLVSKKTNIEYLWNGSPEYWNGRAPVLFPFVGVLKDYKYITDGQTYEMKLQHGIARIRDFTLTNHTANTLTYTLKYDKEALEVYPYRFQLDITYELDHNRLATIYKVKNIDNKTIYFTIGGHPAFMCPMVSGYAFNDYYLEFSAKETLSKMRLNGRLFSRQTEPILNDENKLNLNYDMFEVDAIAFHNTQSNSVALKSDKHSEHLRFYYEGFPFIAFWTKKDAPFLCIEPWYGHADYEDADYELDKKEGIMGLEPETDFSCKYVVEICE